VTLHPDSHTELPTIEQTYVLTIKGAPKSINAGGGGTRANHYAAAAEKKHWQGQFGLELMVAKVRRNMLFCGVTVTVRFKHRSGKGRDAENYRQPIIKPLLDALQAGGYLENDTEEFVKVHDVTLEEGVAEWPHADPRIKSEMIVQLEAAYL
jgi:hypothetical protein